MWNGPSAFFVEQNGCETYVAYYSIPSKHRIIYFFPQSILLSYFLVWAYHLTTFSLAGEACPDYLYAISQQYIVLG